MSNLLNNDITENCCTSSFERERIWSLTYKNLDKSFQLWNCFDLSPEKLEEEYQYSIFIMWLTIVHVSEYVVRIVIGVIRALYRHPVPIHKKYLEYVSWNDLGTWFGS